MPLTPLQHETLGALADCILEGAPAAQESRGELLARCDARLHTLPPHRRARIGTGLDLLGSRVAAVLAGCPPRPIARLSAVERRHCLDAWTESARPPIRSAGMTPADMARFNWLGVCIGLTRDGAARRVSSGQVTVNRRGETSIRYRLTPDDEQHVRASIVAMGRLHLAMGASAVETVHATPIGVRGLYITDGSLLPTALGVNPQETIMAVAQRLSSRLAARHRGVSQ